MTIENVISRAVSLAVNELYGAEADPASVNPAPTKKEFEGDMTVVVFPYLKVSRREAGRYGARDRRVARCE